jgi:hypothetical protein|tara:strand:- start:349 stop:534 length:186 start_codon:yes stop_codon:yes gene_type:complete
MVKIIYKHWTKGHTLEVEGVMPKELNNGKSDRLIVMKADGNFEDVLKSTVVRIESISSMRV